MNWWILLKMKIQDMWNHRFRFSRIGLWLMIFEIAVLVMVVVGTREIMPKFIIQPALPSIIISLLLITQLIILGNSFIVSQRMLFGAKGKVDIVLAVNSRDVLLSTMFYTYFACLRPSLQSPALISLVIASICFPQYLVVLVGLVFLAPISGVILALLSGILLKRFLSRISGLGLIGASACEILGFVGTSAVMLKIVEGTVLNLTWLNTYVFSQIFWWIIFIVLSSLVCLVIIIFKADLWKEAFWIQEECAIRRLGKSQAGKLLALLSFLHLPAPIKAIILKEWLYLWRNPLTILRMIAWVIISLLIYIYLFRPANFSLQFPLLLIYAIWFFCFGELISTAYQVETNRLGLLWLAAISPTQLALGKLLAYLPLAFFSVGTAGLIVSLLGLEERLIFLISFFSMTSVITGMTISLAIGCLSMNKLNNQSSSIIEMAFEQVPLTLASIGSLVILGVVLILSVFMINQLANIAVVSLLYPFLGIVLTGIVIGFGGLRITTYLLKRQYSL